jgi:hypothetical protein
MLLNKLPALDKGWVALIDSTLAHSAQKELRHEFNIARFDKLSDHATATIAMKCPLFVQLHLSSFGLQIVNGTDTNVEAYIPNAGEIGSTDRLVNEEISSDIERTTAALLINPEAYAADGANVFQAQVMTPVNVYTTLIITGTFNQWKTYSMQRNLPPPIESYRLLVKQIIDVEWQQ